MYPPTSPGRSVRCGVLCCLRLQATALLSTSAISIQRRRRTVVNNLFAVWKYTQNQNDCPTSRPHLPCNLKHIHTRSHEKCVCVCERARECACSYETCAVVLAFATGGDTERYYSLNTCANIYKIEAFTHTHTHTCHKSVALASSPTRATESSNSAARNNEHQNTADRHHHQPSTFHCA